MPAMPVLAEHRELPSTVTRAMPGRRGLMVKRATPCAFALCVWLIPGPVTRTRAPANGRLLDSRTLATSVERLPTCSWRGPIVREEQADGGAKTPATVAHSVSELLAVLDSV